jgi:hypothetical protein
MGILAYKCHPSPDEYGIVMGVATTASSEKLVD